MVSWGEVGWPEKVVARQVQWPSLRILGCLWWSFCNGVGVLWRFGEEWVGWPSVGEILWVSWLHSCSGNAQGRGRSLLQVSGCVFYVGARFYRFSGSCLGLHLSAKEKKMAGGCRWHGCGRRHMLVRPWAEDVRACKDGRV